MIPANTMWMWIIERNFNNSNFQYAEIVERFEAFEQFVEKLYGSDISKASFKYAANG